MTDEEIAKIQAEDMEKYGKIKKGHYTNQLKSLKPIEKGEIRNPLGIKGFSLKHSYQIWLSKIPPEQRDVIWAGLFGKAAAGDVNAIKLLCTLNNENPDFGEILSTEDGCRINITLPAKAKKIVEAERLSRKASAASVTKNDTEAN